MGGGEGLRRCRPSWWAGDCFYNCSLFANFSLVKICFQRQCMAAFTAFLCITVLNNALFLVEASNHVSMYSAPKPGMCFREQPPVLAGQKLFIRIVYLVYD